MEAMIIGIGINLNNEKFKDVRVRKALAHAVDKEQIISTLLFGLATPVESMVQPDKKYYNKNLKPYQFDPLERIELLHLHR